MAEFYYYGAPIADFVADDPERIVGRLVLASGFDTRSEQASAWYSQVLHLQPVLDGVQGHIYFEFTVPRIGARIDVVVVLPSVILVLEFKVGEAEFLAADKRQAWDYALDLKYFHLGSRSATIVPVLVATDARQLSFHISEPDPDGVFRPIHCGCDSLAAVFQAFANSTAGDLDGDNWAHQPYSPSPTIIEAARALYANHSVDAIARHGSDAQNLGETTAQIDRLIQDSMRHGGKSIVFVTGVPGAGKTLVGLDAANKRRDADNSTHAVFLSGNGPLVEVLKEALVRDEVRRSVGAGQVARKGEVRRKVKSFIQNVHHFRDAGIIEVDRPPADHVVIFDEAQRAWNAAMTNDFLKRKKGITHVSGSEPELLLSYVDRHPDWAVVICLVGNGQEINRGEAGISTWLAAVRDRFPTWNVFVSAQLRNADEAASGILDELKSRQSVTDLPTLHLSTSMRSFRAQNVSSFVSAALDLEVESAAGLFAGISNRYPVVLTRDLGLAKRWLRLRARGSEKLGLVATSGAMRLKPHAIDVRVEVNPVHWFLNDSSDIRSSSFLEDAATEFQVQGLELDWACVNWDADLRLVAGQWDFRQFVGSKWNRVKDRDRQRYLKNAYRVLLTRARQGMAIFVSPGDPNDPTRLPEFYDSTFCYLRSLGLPVLEFGDSRL